MKHCNHATQASSNYSPLRFLPRKLKRIAFWLLLIFLVACDNPIPANAQPVPPPQIRGDLVFMNLASDVGIQTFRRPASAGFYDADSQQTFVSWMGKDSSPFVQAFDHSTNLWSAPKQVADIRKSSYFEGVDAHNYPTFVQGKDKHLLVFYAEHSSELRLSRSEKPSSIASWQDGIVKEAAFASYPMPVVTSDGDIFVFYRESSYELIDELDRDDRPLQYVRSQDNGKSWQNSQELTDARIALGSWDRKDNLDEIYLGQARYQAATKNSPERIHLVWTIAGGGPEGPQHNRYHKDIYYAYFQPSNLHFYCADDSDQGVNISADEMVKCRVQDTGALSQTFPKGVNNTMLVHFTKDGKPLVVYAIENALGNQIRSALWTGSDWHFADLALDGTLMDIETMAEGRFKVYTAGGRNIKRYVTEDAGISWTKLGNVTLPNSDKVGKVSVLTGFEQPAQLLISAFTDKLTPDANIYLVGDAKCLKTGNYRLKNAETKTYLSNDDRGLDLSSSALNKRQIWHIQNVNGLCQLENERTGSFLSGSGANLTTVSEAKTGNQNWIIYASDEGVYKLKNAVGALHLSTAFEAIDSDISDSWIFEEVP